MNAELKSVKLQVLNPSSSASITAKPADRFDTLQGKTVCEVWATGHFRAHETFPVIRGLLQKQFPDAKFVPYTEFPYGRTSGYPVPLDKVDELLKEKGCDAVLLGNGG